MMEPQASLHLSLPLDVSACLIVRNEEAHLPRALSSLRGICREIIVCDTGSTDRTAEIAGEFGAVVVHHPWQDHFGQARNAALAAATSSFVLVLDADEELLKDSVPALAQVLKKPQLAYLVHNHLLMPGGESTVLPALRLFRRHPGIRYTGRVHEGIVDSLLALSQTEWPDSHVHLRHHGYVDASERRRKGERNLHLLELAVAEEPDNLYLGYKLSITLPKEERRRQKGLLVGLGHKALLLPTNELRSLPFMPPLFAAATDALIQNGELAQAARLAQKAGERLGGSLWYRAGKALFHAGLFPAAESALWRYLDQQGGSPSGVNPLLQKDPEASPQAAKRLLGLLALHCGGNQHGRAEALLKEALALSSEDEDFSTTVASDLVRVYMRSGRMEAAVAALTALTSACQPTHKERYREVMLLSAEVSVFLGDLQGAVPLCQAAIDPEARDDRAAALLCTLLLRGGKANQRAAFSLLPLLPGTRYDTLAVRLLLCRLNPTQKGKGPDEITQATTQAFVELQRELGLAKGKSGAEAMEAR